jgi:hypothetical protein
MTDLYAKEQAKRISKSFSVTDSLQQVIKSVRLKKTADIIAELLRKEKLKCEVEKAAKGYTLFVTRNYET